MSHYVHSVQLNVLKFPTNGSVTKDKRLKEHFVWISKHTRLDTLKRKRTKRIITGTKQTQTVSMYLQANTVQCNVFISTIGKIHQIALKSFKMSKTANSRKKIETNRVKQTTNDIRLISRVKSTSTHVSFNKLPINNCILCASVQFVNDDRFNSGISCSI